MYGDGLATVQDRPSLVAQMLARLGNPLAWNLPDRCLLAAIMSLLSSVYFLAMEFFVLLPRPDLAPYFDRAHFTRRLPWELGLYVGGWSLLIVVALLVRRRPSGGRILVHAVAQLFAVGFAYVSYLFGTITSPLQPIAFLTGAVFGYALFDRLPVLLGGATFLVIVIATTVASQLGWIPYAPAFVSAPFAAGRLEVSWLATLGGTTFVMQLYAYALLYVIIDRWHDREDKLAQTTDQLARANDLISRYVAQQVAEQIRLGNYASIDRQARRRLTLFFSDIKGFTDLADHIEAEELSEILNEYFAEMTMIAERFGGTIDKFMGDATMIFFGAPVATHDEDHALRAVRMAMAMQAHMTELQRRWEKRGITEPFEVRMGLNTGVASVGTFGARGRMDYTAIGRQVNLAARLQVSCRPGKILLSHATWVFVRDQIACEAKGEIQVKGIRDAVRVYEVTAPYVATEGLAT